MRAALLTALVLLVGASAARADTIAVTPEPPGANCAQGGVKITVTPTPPAPPAPPLPDQVSYVCNGPVGDPGADGAPGPPGQDGLDGTPGADGLDGTDGSNGADGFDGTAGTGSVNSAHAPSCGKANRTVTWHLPRRFAHVGSASVVVGGHKRIVLVERGTLLVDLHGLGCGTYPIVVQRKGLRAAVRLFTLSRSGRVVSTPA